MNSHLTKKHVRVSVMCYPLVSNGYGPSHPNMDLFVRFFHKVVPPSSFINPSIYTDWWFGTYVIFPYIGNFIIPTDFHIFQMGRYTTNQIMVLIHCGFPKIEKHKHVRPEARNHQVSSPTKKQHVFVNQLVNAKSPTKQSIMIPEITRNDEQSINY